MFSKAFVVTLIIIVMSIAVAMQWADKQTSLYATVEILLDYNNGNCVFYVVRAKKL
jgi:hypothetical protein